MATGTGKTKVMSLLIAWSWFHKIYEDNSTLARNFLIITPNIIVLDRIRTDFEGLKIFFHDPVLPENGFEGQNWKNDFQLNLHLQDNTHLVKKTGNIFLTNIHRIYTSKEQFPGAEDENTMDYFLGKKPVLKTTDSGVNLGEIVRDIEELMILNDEAHHIHDERLAWFGAIEDINNKMKMKGGSLSLQIDVTATPKHNDGEIFVQTVSDYPLVEAIAQNVVKRPVLPDQASRAKLQEYQTVRFTEKYKDYIHLGFLEWQKTYERLKNTKKSVLFIMTDDTRNCDDVNEYLQKTYPELKDSVLTIHTKNNGELFEKATGKKEKELEHLRKASNEIDTWKSPYKAIVSVLMLKEGWDVRNVTTIVGLRAYAAKSNILPEQTLGRGLRRMYRGRENITEYVSVVGTNAFMDKEQGFVVPKKSVFNKIAGDSHFELEFASFLDRCSDVVSYAKNYLAVNFKLDYVNADGNISNYYPDFIVKLTDGRSVVVETKGQADLDVPLKVARLKQWREDINALSSDGQWDFAYVDEVGFHKYSPQSFKHLLSSFREYKG